MPAKSILSFFPLVLFYFSLTAQEVHVSPDGDDSYPGTKRFPLKTISAAQKMALKTLETSQDAEVTVWMAGGIYPQTEPLVFRSHGEGMLFFKAEKGVEVVISGGEPIIGWIKNEEGIWEAPLPATLAGRMDFRELFLSGKRAIRARFPNEGYLHVKETGEDRRTNFFFEKGDFPIPKAPEGTELVFFHDWSISRVGVSKIDSVESRLYAADSIGARSPDFFTIDNWEPHPRYFLENAREFLDADYEWVFLKDERKFLLKLPKSVDPADLQVFVPVSEGLVSLIGVEGQPVKNVHFEGITFQFSRWDIPQQGYCGVQACHFDSRPGKGAWAVVPAAVSAVWAENVSFVACSFRNLGGSGIWFGAASKNCSVRDSELMDISGNGIMIGEGQDRMVDGQPWWKSAPEQVVSSNAIENCKITQVGAQFFGAVGIWAGLTANTLISRNELFDLPYTGISVGWMWTPDPTPCRENVIAGNHIHQIMKRLSDGGGVYMLGLQPGSKILNNRIHDVKVNAGKAESNGMFLDEGITDVLVEGNLVYDIARSPLRFHRATVNVVRGNYFFSRDNNPPIRYNRTKEEDIQKVDNLSLSENEPTYQGELKRAISNWERNQRKAKKH